MKKFGKKSRKALILFLIVFFASVCFFIAFRRNVKPVIFTYCDALIASVGMESINAGAADVVALYEYSDFVDAIKSSEGKILYMDLNTAMVNGFVRSLALRCENALNAIGKQSIYVPIGAFTGSALMANKGPEIEVDVTFFSSVNCDFVSSFESVGINQTRHSIYARIDVLFNTVLPIAEHEISLSNRILIAENLIVGDVPNVYVSDEKGTDYLDLIP